MSKVCGIDLGTGFSAVAIMEAGNPIVIANNEGSRTTPSVVQINGDNLVVGNTAKRSMVTKPKNTVSFVKRLMGSDYKDSDVQKMISLSTYNIVDENGKPYVEIDGKKFSPEQISSMILSQMKKTAEEYCGETVDKAVITCPAWFNNVQRQATKLAGELAGFEVLRVINEPTAAMLSANLLNDGKDKIVAVFDLGCGTLDISVCEISDGLVEVLASDGDTFLGGKDYDDAIVKYVIDEYKKESGIDLSKDQMAYTRIVEAAEKAKIELSSSTSTDINLPYICMTENGAGMLNVTLTRAKFEQITSSITDRCISKTKSALSQAVDDFKKIDCILLVGGSTRIPSVQDALTKNFGIALNQGADKDQAVALGAAIQADILAGNTKSDLLLLDVTPISLGIETLGGVMTKLVDANTTIPTKKTKVFSTAVDNQPSVEIVVLQGERQMASDNKCIGRFHLDGIPMAPRGIPQIEVSFDIDASGMVSVSAKDLGTGKEQNIRIENQSLTQEEIDNIKADAEKYAEEDRKKREAIDKKNDAESYAYQLMKTCEDESFKDKLSSEQKDKIKELANKLIDEASKDGDIDGTKSELESYWSTIINDIYKSTGGNSSTGTSNPFSGSNNPFGDNNPFAQGMADGFGPK